MTPENDTWLLIETSGRVGKVGLARSGVVRARELDAARRHARDLTSTLAALLEQESLRPGDIGGVMVGIGPGSYTGLRVGVMSAKAIAYATRRQLIAVPTFHTIARQAPPEARKLWVIADALQGQIYLQQFERVGAGNLMVPVADLAIVRAEESLNGAGPDIWMTGPGVNVHADRNIPRSCPLVPEADREPSVASLYEVGRTLPALSREALFLLEPLYLRGSSAEEKAKRRE